MATHSSILAWRIPWTEEQSMGLQRVRCDWATDTFAYCRYICYKYLIIEWERIAYLIKWFWLLFSHWVMSTLCNPMDCSAPGSSVHEISQPRKLEWVAICFSRGTFESGIEPASLALANGFFTTELPRNFGQVVVGHKSKWNEKWILYIFRWKTISGKGNRIKAWGRNRSKFLRTQRVPRTWASGGWSWGHCKSLCRMILGFVEFDKEFGFHSK